MLSYHDEEDDGGGENVDLLSLVRLVQVDFWCHIVHGAELGGQVACAIFTLNGCSEAKISDLENEILV